MQPLPTFIDSHCHLEPNDFRRKPTEPGEASKGTTVAAHAPIPPAQNPAESGPESDERPDVLARARAAGVNRLIVIGSGSGRSEIENALAMAHAHGHIDAAIGIHPHDAKNIEGSPEPSTSLRDPTLLTDEAATLWNDIERLATDPRVVAVGETGLDYHYNHSTPAAQRALFRRFVRLSTQVKKPLSLHIRDAHAEALQIIAGDGDPLSAARHGGVVHCFTGTREEARAWLDRGFHISLSGVVTFKNAAALREAACFVPSDRLLLETDSPYLAPVPLRGRRNEPANLIETARCVAGLRGVSLDRLAAETTAACLRLFSPAATEEWAPA